jgi:2-polyprenyl-3-methyl-5-hydroxy-6-metoxy-1,4-benzoquinol methylase
VVTGSGDERKQAEIDYPRAAGAIGREWLRIKPFRATPRVTGRHLVDFGYIVQLLELAPGVRLCELGCGPGWLTRLAARCGAEAVGYDISPEMVAIAREQAAAEGSEARFEVADMEQLDLGRSFDACLVYDALHHSTRPDLVLDSAYRALRPGGALLVCEPNWSQRATGRAASDRWGTTELGYSPRHLKRLLHGAGFTRVERFHGNRKRLYSNSAVDVAWHLAEPVVYRLLSPFLAQVWLRARAGTGERGHP